jgi:hypothetical protein
MVDLALFMGLVETIVQVRGVSGEGLRRNALVVLSHGGYNI